MKTDRNKSNVPPPRTRWRENLPVTDLDNVKAPWYVRHRDVVVGVGIALLTLVLSMIAHVNGLLEPCPPAPPCFVWLPSESTA